MNKRIVFLFIILNILNAAFAQLATTMYIDALFGAAMTSQDGRDTLPHGTFGAGLGFFTNGPWGLTVQTGGVYQTPTTYSDYWYRYRGYFGLTTAIGARHDFGTLDVYVSAGGMLARYDLSYSWFWFPYIQAGIDVPVARLNDRVLMALGLSVPVYFRADSHTTGIIATARFVSIPPHRNSTIPGATP